MRPYKGGVGGGQGKRWGLQKGESIERDPRSSFSLEVSPVEGIRFVPSILNRKLLFILYKKFPDIILNYVGPFEDTICPAKLNDQTFGH